MRFGLDPLSEEEVAAMKVAAETDMESEDERTRRAGFGWMRLLESHEHFREYASHKPDCLAGYTANAPCSCGLVGALPSQDAGA